MKRSAPDARTEQAISRTPSPIQSGLPGPIPAAVFTLDQNGCIASWTAASATLFGRPAAEILGRPCQSLFPPDAHSGLAEALERAAKGEIRRAALPVLPSDGLARQVVLSCSPLIDSVGRPGLLCEVSDLEQTRQTEAKLAFTDALMEASSFGLAVLDNDLRYVLVNDLLAKINRLPSQAHVGRRLSDVVRLEDGGEYEQRLRGVLQTGNPLHDLLVGGRAPGHPDRDGAWSVTSFRLTDRDGEVLGLGIMVVDITDKETAEREAKAVRRRLDLVNQASSRVGTTLEMAQTARELAEVAVPAFADIAAIEVRKSLFDDGDFPPADKPVRTLRLASRNILDSPAAEHVFPARCEVVHAPGSRSHLSLHKGQAWLTERLDEEAIAELAQSGAHARLLRESGLQSLVTVPLVARGRCIGIAEFGRSARREPITCEDLKVAEELAARAAICLDNAQMYNNERRIAVALQRSMLPGEKDIPQRSGLEVAHHYRPSSRAAKVGGDWFDVIPLSGHRVALVIGDMMGHDIRAAASMGQLRTAMRTLARLDLEPVDLLNRLDDIVESEATIQYATCAYAVYDTVTRHCSIANAGHPAPILRYEDGTTEMIPVTPGVPLGVGVGDPDFAVTDLTLPDGSTLVLFTDGLIERRGEDIDVGIGAVRAALASPAASVQELCDSMIAELHRRPEHDDLAVLMAQVPAMPDHRFTSSKLPCDPKSPSLARTLVRQTLHNWGLDALVDTTELLVSELVTNVVRHARGNIELRLAKARTLVTEVADGDERMPRRFQAHADDERGRGLMLVSEFACAWGTRPTATGKVVWFEVPLPG